MTDMNAFEQRFAESLRTYAAPAARPPRREAVARAVAGRKARTGNHGWLSGLSVRRLSMAVAASAAPRRAIEPGRSIPSPMARRLVSSQISRIKSGVHVQPDFAGWQRSWTGPST